jgi:SPP1 family predicted phage head-tail adaptor
MTDSWATQQTVWASVHPAQSAEGEEADHSVARRTHEIMMRPNTNVNADCRFLFDSRYLYPVGPPRDYQERGIYVAVDCKETMI